ncbi:hypothetical protein [Sorangium sp. So ce1389]|uniref:hypothetical protein n=1 Tax=Sorangium sp. So ce1389 TaxID=3133336 RepID=UPI003F62A016
MSFHPTKGPARAQISSALLDKLERLGGAEQILKLYDGGRRRPLYFDGRFLSARDLTREQDYVLSRQAALGRAGGFGVVSGLLASQAAQRVRIEPGHGVTPSGELVVVTEALELDLASAHPTDAIQAQLGVARMRQPSAGARTGVFVVALRPVEYEANPVAQYPTTLDGERGVHNGDIIEATAVTLIPYPDLGAPTELRFMRAQAAKEIFVDRTRAGFVTDALPIAMVALERGVLRWVDPHLVRREIGAEAGDILGVSGTPLALREAHMLQHDQHLADVLAAAGGGRFAASQHFVALPPTARMPLAAIDRQSLTQSYFPAEVDVDLSVIPEDELGPLLEESRLLPPIDLTAPEDLRATSVLVLVPVPRQDLTEATAALVGRRRKLPPAAPNLLARRKPLERMMALPTSLAALRPFTLPVVPADPWRQLLAGLTGDTVWFVRRRNLASKPSIEGELVSSDAEGKAALADRLAPYGVGLRDVNRIDPEVWSHAARKDGWLLRLADRSPLFAAAAVVALSNEAPVTTEGAGEAVSSRLNERFTLPPDEVLTTVASMFGEGTAAARLLVRAGFTPAFARLLHDVPRALRDTFSKQITDIAGMSSPLPVKVDLASEVIELASETAEQADLAEDLAPYGIELRDMARIDPHVWSHAKEWLVQWAARTLLFTAAAVVALSSEAPVSDTNAGLAISDKIRDRFTLPPDDVLATVHQVFRGGTSQAQLLVRSGVTPDLAARLHSAPAVLGTLGDQIAAIAGTSDPIAAKVDRVEEAIQAAREAAEHAALLQNLAPYGIQLRDLTRIDPQLWSHAGEWVASLARSWPLFAAAAVVALSNEAPVSATNAGQVASRVEAHFNAPPGTLRGDVDEVFRAGEPETQLLVRSGVTTGFVELLLNATRDTRLDLRNKINNIAQRDITTALKVDLLQKAVDEALGSRGGEDDEDRDILGALRSTGIDVRDLQRIQPAVWSSARSWVKSLSKDFPLLGGAAVMELSRAGSLRDDGAEGFSGEVDALFNGGSKAILQNFASLFAGTVIRRDTHSGDTPVPVTRGSIMPFIDRNKLLISQLVPPLVRTGLVLEVASIFSRIPDEPGNPRKISILVEMAKEVRGADTPLMKLMVLRGLIIQKAIDLSSETPR